MARIDMHAIVRSFWLGSDTTNRVKWVTAAFCTSAALGNIVLFARSPDFPASLLTLNLITFASIWLWMWRNSRLIQLQPQELAQRMLDVQETERQRLSRELHDDIGQMLTGAQLQLAWLQRRLPDALNTPAGQLESTLAETLEKVRDLSTILNPRQLSSLGLEDGLRAHLVIVLANSQINWSLECRQHLNGVPEEMAVAAYRVCQEAVTNMLRHAQAKNLLIRFERQPAGLLLLIADDGTGFEPAVGPRPEGNGLTGMRERVMLLDGSWSLHSGPGRGTRIEVMFPWAPRSGERARLHKKTQ